MDRICVWWPLEELEETREKVQETGRETETGKKYRGGKEVEGRDGAMGCPTHVTQMVKQSAEPMKAMMLSNAGKAIEIAKNRRIVTTRMTIFAKPLE